MTKQDEIKLIEQLADSDTSFADEFSNDMDQIFSNIEKGFPFLTGIGIEKDILEKDCKIELRDKILKENSEKLRKQEIDLISLQNKATELNEKNAILTKRLEKSLRLLIILGTESEVSILNIGYTKRDIIACKVKNNIDLDEKESDMVIDMIRNNLDIM